MRRGAAISGGLHGVLVVLAILGADWFRDREPVPLNVTEIDMVDGTQLDARLSTAPVVQSEGPAELSPPAPGESLPTPDAPPDQAAEPAAAAALAMSTPPQPRPDAPQVNVPPPPTAVPSEAPVPTIAEIPSPDPLREQSSEPESPPSTEPVTPLASVRPTSPSPRPTPPPQAEPEPQPEPEPEPEEATVPQPTAPEPPTPQPEPAETPEPEPEPQLAAAEPDAPQSLAPREARLPVARPADRARAAPASSRPEPPQQQVAAEEPEPEEQPQQTAQAEPQPAQPAGGSSRPTAPLSQGEKDALRLGIKRYYTYNGDRSDRSLQVTIRVRLDQQAQIVGKPERVDAQGGNPGAQQALFDAGRRALLQAQSAGEFRRLPTDKYAAWSVLNVVFTTEQEVVF